jgi:hypothetical protein
MKIIQSRANKETNNNHSNHNKQGGKKQQSFEVHEIPIYKMCIFKILKWWKELAKDVAPQDEKKT